MKKKKIQSKVQLKVEVWIYYKNSQGDVRILLLKTKPSRGSFWQPITGSVEKKETLIQAALREAQEETGLTITQPVRPLDFSFQYKKKEGALFNEHVFSIFLKARKKNGIKIKLDPHEHVQACFVSIPKALLLLQFAANKKALRILQKFIGNCLPI